MTPATAQRLRLLIPVILLGVILLAWQIASGPAETFILPSPASVFRALIDDWAILGPATWITIRLTLIALFLAIVIGGGLALLMAQSRWVEWAIFPYAVILQVTPIIAIAPMILIWVPDTPTALTILAFIVAFFPILANTIQGLKSADHNLLSLFELYGAGRWQTLRRLLIPSALPFFLTGVRTAGGLALIGAVIAEFAAGAAGRGSGLAYRIFEAQFHLDTPLMFAALLLLAVTGIAIFMGTGLAAYFLTRRWHESAAIREN